MPVLLNTVAIALLGTGITCVAQGAIEFGVLLLVSALLSGLSALAVSIRDLS